MPKHITDTDRKYITKIIHDAGYDISALRRPESYTRQLFTIRAVQDAALETTPQTRPIPLYEEREPRNLYKRKAANCNARSRFMDKALRYLGFQTRYVYIHASGPNGLLRYMISGESREKPESHALIEVKTSRGWLFVDSVSPWLALTDDDRPVSLREWQAVSKKKAFAWKNQPGGELFPVLNGPFVYFYGLYSLHGRFYPPYWYVPDINWSGFISNFVS